MGFPKALLRYRDETFLDTLIGLFAARCQPVIVVLGAHAEPDPRSARCGRPRSWSTRITSAARPVPCSAACAPCPQSAEGVLFTLVDHPAVAPATLDRCCSAQRPPAPLVRVPRYQGRRGHPIWFSRQLIAEFLALARERRGARYRAQPRRRDRIPGRRRRGHPGGYRRSRRPTAASPEHPCEAPHRPALQAPRRIAGAAVDRRCRGAFVHRRSVRRRLQASLERALGRRVEIGKVHFNLFKGPGFSVDNVTIYEDPAIGMEPVVYIQEPGSMEVAPSIWSLLGGKFVIASIRLDGASINLTKSGPASEWGRWNFASLVNPSVIRTAPGDPRARQPHPLQVRRHQERLLSHRDRSGYLAVRCPAAIGRSPVRPSPRAPTGPRRGLGSFTLKGRWYAEPGRVDLDMEVDRAALGEVTALMSGQDAGRARHAEFAPAPGRAAQQHGDHRPPGYRRCAPLGHDAGQQPGLAPGDPRAGST